MLLRLERGFRFPESTGSPIEGPEVIDELREWFNLQLGAAGAHSELDTRLAPFLYLKRI
jgi:hypothetical protein